MKSAERAELVAERDFLLRSIADLDAEQAAGDLAADDFAALRDDYVARAAAVMRSLDSTSPDRTFEVYAAVGRVNLKSSIRRPLLVVAGCAVVAALAGVALASAAGSRPAGAPLSGSLPATTADRMARASAFLAEGKPVEAVKLYDRILKDDPDQPAALAYRGWVVRLAGLKEQGLAYEDRAIAADPSYPDAHFFRGMMLWQDKGDPAAAVAEFRLFLSNRPPRSMVPLVEDALRRAAQEAGLPSE